MLEFYAIVISIFQQVTVDPNSSEDVHILFKPSAIGVKNHATELVFTSEQVQVSIINSMYKNYKGLVEP